MLGITRWDVNWLGGGDERKGFRSDYAAGQQKNQTAQEQDAFLRYSPFYLHLFIYFTTKTLISIRGR